MGIKLAHYIKVENFTIQLNSNVPYDTKKVSFAGSNYSNDTTSKTNTENRTKQSSWNFLTLQTQSSFKMAKAAIFQFYSKH